MESILLYQDEKGPIAAKTYGGISWSQVQSKVERAQKIKGILNVFGVYDHTNDQMYTHSYRNKTGKQFLDFIKRIDRKYNSSIKQIFLLLDNISIQRSLQKIQMKKQYKNTIQEEGWYFYLPDLRN